MYSTHAHHRCTTLLETSGSTLFANVPLMYARFTWVICDQHLLCSVWFVSYDSLRPSQHFFSSFWVEPVLSKYYFEFDYCLELTV